MTPAETLSALILVAKAEPEATEQVIKAYEKLPLNEKQPIMAKARTVVSNGFGLAGTRIITDDCMRAGRAAASRAGIRDHYVQRTVEVATECLALALLGKPYLKSEEFLFLLRPWGPHLPAEYSDPEGSDQETPPPSPQRPRSETSRERKRRESADERDRKRDARQSLREEKRAARAEARRERQLEAAAPVDTDDLVAAALGLEGITSPPPRRQRERASFEDGVRIFYSKRRQTWLLIGSGSMATVTDTRFPTQAAAQAHADEQGWKVVGVKIPRGSEAAA